MDHPPDLPGIQGLRVHLVLPRVQEPEVRLEVQLEALVDPPEVPVDHLEVLVDHPEVPEDLPEVLEDHLGDLHMLYVELCLQPCFLGLVVLQGGISYTYGQKHCIHMG